MFEAAAYERISVGLTDMIGVGIYSVIGDTRTE
jgi:hypothetical protein